MGSNVSRRQFVISTAALAASGATLARADRDGNASPTPTANSPADVASANPDTAPIAPLNPAWPILRRYGQTHIDRIAMPLGGIGTGCISLGGRGVLCDWELVNKPAYGYAPINTFFSLYTKDSAGRAVTRCLEGPLPVSSYEGPHGSPVRNHGLPRFRYCEFAATYPLGQVLLADPDVPLRVRIEAFNPLIPANADDSGIPIVSLRVVLTNPTAGPIDATVCGTVENFIGWDGDSGRADRNVNEYRPAGVRGYFMRSAGVDPKSPAWGTLAFCTTAEDLTHRADWADLSWGDSLLDFWDDLSADGKLDDRKSNRPAPFPSLAPHVTVPANGAAAVTFLLAWHFPNRTSWTAPAERIGNYYCTRYADAWDVIAKESPRLAELEARTVTFVKAFAGSDVPPAIKDAALANVSTLRTQTVFRTEDGNFFGWEGCNDFSGSCHGSCTHVWNYEQTTAHLFGSLAMNARRTEFAAATDGRGLMSFRVNLPLAHARDYQHAAADGQMGTIMRLYREWRLSGDDAFLKELYPHARRALEFAWIPGGWDADMDGVMEGCQHNTMDVEYFGPNPEIGVWYLGALRATEEMARHAGDSAFADKCHDLFRRGADWFDQNLFNGDYYEQRIIPGDIRTIAPGLTNSADAAKAADPVLQIGSGCLADQLVGQSMAHVCGLGYLLKQDNVRQTLRSVMRYNYRADFYGHFNHLRSYSLGDDRGLLVATYPKGRRPARPFPYCNEVWSGIEYTAATGMIYEGQFDDALTVATAARDRHDGRKRNPFDEEECGHHYARAMAAWGLYLAYTGFSYDGRSRTLGFSPTDRPATWFFSTGHAWGTIKQDPTAGNATVTLLGGALPLDHLKVGQGSRSFAPGHSLLPDKPLAVTFG